MSRLFFMPLFFLTCILPPTPTSWQVNKLWEVSPHFRDSVSEQESLKLGRCPGWRNINKTPTKSTLIIASTEALNIIFPPCIRFPICLMVSHTLQYDIANVLLKTPSPPQTHNQHVHYIKKKYHLLFTFGFCWEIFFQYIIYWKIK